MSHYDYEAEENPKKELVLGLGLAILAGIGFYAWSSQKEEPASSLPTGGASGGSGGPPRATGDSGGDPIKAVKASFHAKGRKLSDFEYKVTTPGAIAVVTVKNIKTGQKQTYKVQGTRVVLQS